MKDTIEYSDEMYCINNLQELIEWHGIKRVKQCYFNFVDSNYTIYAETANLAQEIASMNSFQLSKELFDDIVRNDQLDMPAIETKLIRFIEEYE